MAPNKNYTVDKKDEIRTIGKGAEVLTVYRIYATSTKGTYFHVDVPETELANADKFLSARASALDSIL